MSGEWPRARAAAVSLALCVLLVLLVLTAGGVGAGGCASSKPGGAGVPTPQNPEMILATTTSVQDSGLLDVMIPLFEKATGYRVKTIAVGTGQALALAARGEADAVLVHAPASEEKAEAAGTVVNRRALMRNDFVIVGPADDPAGIQGVPSAPAALVRLWAARDTGMVFVSRGDDSGTHQKEKDLWARAGLAVSGGAPAEAAAAGTSGGAPKPAAAAWYQQTGQGMGQTLTVAWEKRAYTLTDRATYLTLESRLDLVILVEGDPALANPYHVMQVNPQKFPRVNAEGGKAFVEFMVSPQTQAEIGRYGVDKYGVQLFTPESAPAKP